MPQMPLLVHFVFHPDSTASRELAVGVCRSLNHDAIVPGLDIPTVFVDCSEASPPADQGLDRAERSFVVVLADDHIVAGEEAAAWQEFVANIWKETRGTAHRFVPIQLSPNAWGFNDDLTEANVSFGRAFHEVAADRKCELVNRVVATELVRFLLNEGIGQQQTQAPVKFFISHAKQDLTLEPKVVNELKATLTADQPIEAWIDSGQIEVGSNFATEIEDGIKTSSLLAVLTDNYATREWCRTEVLLAKEHQRPIVVVDALQKFEVRSFPYLGNVPVVRWETGKPYRAIDLLIKESIRQLHTRLRLEQWREDADQITVRPPELATIGHAKDKNLLYPDPPLGAEETKLLDQLGINATTPLERMARNNSLDGKRIAMSMSESSDIEKYGFDELHMDNTIVELSRYLLIQGATLAYGGHTGKDGVTANLFELVRSHNQIDRTENVKPIVNYVGWPVPRPSLAKRADFNRVGQFQFMDRPEELTEADHEDFVPEPAYFPETKSALHRFAWSIGMTEMRTKQTSETCARIVLGGKTDITKRTVEPDGTTKDGWYKSRIPGLLEEVYVSARANQPVFLIGAFGGAAAMVIDIIEGKDRPEASWDFQKNAPHSEEMRQLYSERGIEWEGYEEIVDFLRQKGVSGINPLLTEDENLELFRTIDLMRMVELVLRGLNNLSD